MNNATLPSAWERYSAYDSAHWIRAYFDAATGGFCVYHKRHNFAKEGGGGEAEKQVGIRLARLGKQVEFLPEGGAKSPDLFFDGQTWDVKVIDDANEETMRKRIKDARKADNAIFYFTTDKLSMLRSAAIREGGKLMRKQRIGEMPDVYYFSREGELKLLWQKPKGAA